VVRTPTLHKKWVKISIVTLVILIFISLCWFLYFSFFYSYSYVNAIRGFHAISELKEEKSLIIRISEKPLKYMTLKENFEKALAEISDEHGFGKLYAGVEYNRSSRLPYAAINGIDYWYNLGSYSRYCYLITFIPWDEDIHGYLPER
jgi:hypothetical protein